MPIFDFMCLACGHTEEKLVKLTDEPKCPTCEEIMKRELGRPAFRFENGHGTGLGNLMSIASNPPKSQD